MLWAHIHFCDFKITMSLSKSLSGRKRDSVFWEFFSYDEDSDKSTCQVTDETTKVACGTQITGKNTSNFAAHLKRFHKQAYANCMSKEKERNVVKSQAVKRDSSGAVKLQTIGECLQRRMISWPEESAEHRVLKPL